MKDYKIIIADEHEFFRIGLEDILKASYGITNIYQAANGKMSPAGNGPSGIPRSSASPHMAHAVQAQQLSSATSYLRNRAGC